MQNRLPALRYHVVRVLLGRTVTLGQRQGRLVTALGEIVRHYVVILWLVCRTGKRAPVGGADHARRLEPEHHAFVFIRGAVPVATPGNRPPLPPPRLHPP